MQVQRMERRPHWLDPHPIQDRLLQYNANSGRSFLVDMGGEVSHDLAAFVAKYPELTPRLVLEDQPHVLADVDKQDFKLDDRVQRLPMDFFKEQPVKESQALLPSHHPS